MLRNQFEWVDVPDIAYPQADLRMIRTVRLSCQGIALDRSDNLKASSLEPYGQASWAGEEVDCLRLHEPKRYRRAQLATAE